MTLTLLALALVAALLLAAYVFGQVRWQGLTQTLLDRLEDADTAVSTQHFNQRDIAGLPAPVQRYFRKVLRDGAPIAHTVAIGHHGSFNLDAGTDRWKPFTSRQRIVTQRPGFVWDARIALLPGLAVHVHDAYIAGQGLLHAAFAGLVGLADLRGGDEMARGELMRFLAEAAWYPTALLPSQGVRWTPIDDDSANATLVDGNVAVTLSFLFTPEGFVRSVRADARGRSVGGRIVPTPWIGHWSDHQLHDGHWVPMRGEVAWLLDGGEKAYWRGSVDTLVYGHGG